MLGGFARAVLALASMEARAALKRAGRRVLRSLRSRPMGLPERPMPLSHRDSERIAEAGRRAGNEDGVERDP